MKNFHASKKVKKESVGQIICIICIIVTIIDLVINKLHLWGWLIVFFMFTGLFLNAGWKKTLKTLAVSSLAVLVFIYILILQSMLSGNQIDLDNSITLRITIIGILAIFILGSDMFLRSTKEFFRNLWEILSVPKISKALTNLIISYFGICLLFCICYASLYLFIGPTSFNSDKPLKLLDFLHYSVFIPMTMGYPDISPNHWLLRIITLIEIFFGFIVVSIYLGTIVGNISEYISRKGE